MVFLADESVDGKIVKRLRIAGFQVKDIKEISPGIPDSEVLSLANAENALLITEDKDFGELVFRLKMAAKGVILVRLSGWLSKDKGNYVVKVVQELKNEFEGSFTVIGINSIRQRKLLE
ncbi:MAG: DUF5615 family PIN-like protein [Bacteroidota bacterium]